MYGPEMRWVVPFFFYLFLKSLTASFLVSLERIWKETAGRLVEGWAQRRQCRRRSSCALHPPPSPRRLATRGMGRWGKSKEEEGGPPPGAPPGAPPPMGGMGDGYGDAEPYRMRMIQDPIYAGSSAGESMMQGYPAPGGGGYGGGYGGGMRGGHINFGVSPITDPDKYGVMKKRRAHNNGKRQWKERWFILKNHMLFYYSSDPMKQAQSGEMKDALPDGIVCYRPDEVAVYDDGTGTMAIHLQQRSGSAFMLSSDDPALLDEWAAELMAVPPELKKVVDELARTTAELSEKKRELRNQSLEMEQIEEVRSANARGQGGTRST